MLEVLGEVIGKSLVATVKDDRQRARRLRRMGLWGIQNISRSAVGWVDYVTAADLAKEKVVGQGLSGGQTQNATSTAPIATSSNNSPH